MVAVEELSSSSPGLTAAGVLFALVELLGERGDGMNALGAAVGYARTSAGRLNGRLGSLADAELLLLPLLTTRRAR